MDVIKASPKITYFILQIMTHFEAITLYIEK